MIRLRPQTLPHGAAGAALAACVVLTALFGGLRLPPLTVAAGSVGAGALQPGTLAQPVPTSPAHPCPGAPGISSSGASFPRTLHLGRPLGDMVVSQATGHVFIVIQSAYEDQLHGCPTQLLMLDGRSGALLRTIAIPGEVTLPAVDDPAHRLILSSHVGSGSAQAILLDTRDLRVVATVTLPGTPGAIIPVGSTGRVFVNVFTGPPCPCSILLQMLDAATGRLLLAHPPKGAQSFAVDERDKRLYMINASHLVTLDARSAQQLWRLDVAPCEGYALAFVPFTHRLLLAKAGYYDPRADHTEHGYFCVVDTTTRRRIRREDLGSAGLFPLAVDSRVRAVLGASLEPETIAGVAPPRPDGSVVLLNPYDGQILRLLGVAAASAVVDQQTGRVYLLDRTPGTSGAWTLWSLDPHSWRKTVLARSHYASIAVLVERWHRLFLSGSSSTSVRLFCTIPQCR